MAQSQSKASSSKAILALLLLAFIWGYNWVQMKIAVQYASPFTFAAIRNGLGGLVLLLVMIGLRKPLKPQAIGGSFLLGVLQSSGVYGLANWALV
ncbi:MAG: EamA family transporter, partial [Leptolyngbyaceae cyanobacterium CAN_BIN12]|nr:EamA family transporter [Leptolyngbyaceae cyanobacterium CAN_BIN12]